MSLHNILHFYLPQEITCSIFSQFLAIEDISLFDRAMCNNSIRPLYLECIGSESCVWFNDKEKKLRSNVISWLCDRNMKIGHLKCEINDKTVIQITNISKKTHTLEVVNNIRNTVDDVKMIQIIQNSLDLKELKISECHRITDLTISKIGECCFDLEKLNINGFHNFEGANNINELNITNISVIKVLENCPKLKHLQLSWCPLISDLTMMKIAQHSKHIETLDIAGNENITHQGIVTVVESCPNIVDLELSCCWSVCDDTLRKIAEKYPGLRRVRLGRCMVSDEGLMRLVEGCLLLVEIDVAYCESVSDISVVKIAQNCALLKRVDVSHCDLVTNIGMFAIASHCLCLETLCVSGCANINDIGVMRVVKARGSTIKRLNLAHCRHIHDISLQEIGRSCPNLQDVNLYQCRNITSSGVVATTEGCLLLTSLYISHCRNMENILAEKIGENLHYMEMLGLSNCSAITATGIMKIAEGCPKLRYIDLSNNSNINDSSILKISECCKNIETVNLSYYANVSEAVVRLLPVNCYQWYFDNDDDFDHPDDDNINDENHIDDNDDNSEKK